MCPEDVNLFLKHLNSLVSSKVVLRGNVGNVKLNLKCFEPFYNIATESLVNIVTGDE